MRFGNSSNYFGLNSNHWHWIALNPATSRAFHQSPTGWAGALARIALAMRQILHQTNSAVDTCSKVTEYQVEAAPSMLWECG
jgi:hypothetical protein